MLFIDYMTIHCWMKYLFSIRRNNC